MEVTTSFAATASAVNSGTIQWWVRYNSNMSQSVTVAASTSYQHAIAEENVVVRVPAGVPGTLAGVLIQNDSAADELDGLRVLSQSTYEIPTNMWKAFNSNLMNGVVYADANVSTTEQQYAWECAGALFVPLFGLTTDSDLVLQVNSTAATTRTYTPVLTAPLNARGEPQGTQTEALPSSVSAAVISQAED